VKLADQTKLKDTKNRGEFGEIWGCARVKMRPVFSFSSSFFGGGLLPRVKHCPPRACGTTSHLLNAPYGQLTRGRMGCPGREIRRKKLKIPPSMVQGLRHAHRGGLYRVYIPLYPVQCFPANKQVVKNSESYVRFFFFFALYLSSSLS